MNHGPQGPTAELPQDFDSYSQQTNETPGAFSDAVLERIRTESLEPLTPSKDDNDGRVWSLPTAFLVWFFSLAIQEFIFPAMLILGYYTFEALRGVHMTPEILLNSRAFRIIGLSLIFPAHLTTLLLAWAVVTKFGKRPFLKTLGWGWHRRFQPWHALLFVVFIFFVLARLAEHFLPHPENTFEKTMLSSAAARYIIAAAAVVTAPLVEEVIYRGVLYVPIERKFGPVLAVIIVTVLFAGVHVPQYWPSYATLSIILTLSLGLTIIRAATKSILPAYFTHFVFNAIQVIPIFIGHSQ